MILGGNFALRLGFSACIFLSKHDLLARVTFTLHKQIILARARLKSCVYVN